MCIRAYLVLQTDGAKSQEVIRDLLNKPGIVTADWLEGPPNLIVVVEAETRQELVRFIEQTLDLVESITRDLRFFIGRESHLSFLAESAA
jgi:nitrate reductase NapAB chaperone NapD